MQNGSMAIRLKLSDGSVVEADSVDELLKYQQSLHSSRNGAKLLRAQRRATPVTNADEELPEHARKLVELLLPQTEGMDSAEIAKHFDVDPRGVGGYVTSLTRWGDKAGLKKKELIVKERRDNGNGDSVRRIKLTVSFRKMLKDGKVPGMKLDT